MKRQRNPHWYWRRSSRRSGTARRRRRISGAATMESARGFHEVAATGRDDAAVVEVDVQAQEARVLQQDQQRAQRGLGDVVALFGVAEADALEAVGQFAAAVLEEVVDETAQRGGVHCGEETGGVELREGLVGEKGCAESCRVARTIASDLLDVFLDGADAEHVDDGLGFTRREKSLSPKAGSRQDRRPRSRR